MTQEEEKLILKGIIVKLTKVLKSHSETVKEELFETPMGGSTRESINTNTNYKSRSTKIPAPKVPTQQKRDSLVATSERSEGEDFPNRSTTFTSKNVTKGRYQTRSASGITRPRKLKVMFYSRITVKMKNLVMMNLFKKVMRQNAEGVEPTLERAPQLKTSPIG